MMHSLRHAGYKPRLSDYFSIGKLCFTLAGMLMLFPTFWMVTSAFKTPQEIIAYPPKLFPEVWNIDALVYVWNERNFSLMMFNSTLVSTLVTIATVFSSAYIGYVFCKFDFRYRMPLFYIIVATMMIPLPVLLIPHFQIVLTLGWVNTYQALIAPFVLNAFGIFLMYQFLSDFPDELIEAARVEGVSETWIFIRIVLPLNRAPCIALGIITFLHQWESLLWPIVAANSPDMATLPLGLATFKDGAIESTELFNPYAAALIAAAPLLILFMFFQRVIVKGIALSGMKK